MVENKEDELARAFAMLSSLRKNIGQMTTREVPEIYVGEFHTVLDRLEGIQFDVAEFRIPDSAVQPKIVGPVISVRGGKRIRYSKEKYVDKSFILTRLDSILGYFEIITSEKPRKIGFSRPDSS
jgi:hypothetical protein